MDCFKIAYHPEAGSAGVYYGVFHSSKEQSGSGYNALYFAEPTSISPNEWTAVKKLSSRGSQGYIYLMDQMPKTAFLVLYEL